MTDMIHHLMCKQRGIPPDFLIGRLLVMTKNSSPIAPIEKTRPIVVQTLAIRIVEKVIKQKLDT